MSQDFKNRREIFQWLLDGGKVKNNMDSEIVFLEEDGIITTAWPFAYPEAWSKYIPEKPKVKYALYRATKNGTFLATEMSGYPENFVYGHIHAFKVTDDISPDWRLIPGSEFEDEE
jgi:hypothetical protein